MRTYVLAAVIIAAGIGWAATIRALNQAGLNAAELDQLRSEVLVLDDLR